MIWNAIRGRFIREGKQNRRITCEEVVLSEYDQTSILKDNEIAEQLH